MTITQSPASTANYSTGRFGAQLNLIVAHTMAGFFQGTAAWFGNPGSHVSTHYGVGLNGAIDQYVADMNTAWAVGVWDYNIRSLSIEFEDDDNPSGVVRTPQQYLSGAELIAAVCRDYNIPCDRAHIIGHREVPGNDHPDCPGNLNIDQLVQEASQILEAQNAPQAAPAVEAVAHTVTQAEGGTLNETVEVVVPILNTRVAPTTDSALGPQLHRGTVQVTAWVDGQTVTANGRTDRVWLKTLGGHFFTQTCVDKL